MVSAVCRALKPPSLGKTFVSHPPYWFSNHITPKLGTIQDFCLARVDVKIISWFANDIFATADYIDKV